MGKGRSQIGESAQSLTDLQQPCFGTAVRWKGIEFIAADSAEQYGIAFERGVECRRGKRCSMRLNRHSADQRFANLEVVASQLCHGTQNACRFVSDFRAYAVSGNDKNLQLHRYISSRLRMSV